MHQNLKSSILIFVLFTATLWACDPCNDCGPLAREPSVGLFFINGDSLDVTIDSLSVVDTLLVVSDSLLIVIDSINSGALGYEDEKQALENFIDGLTSLRLSSENLSDTLSAIASELSSIISLIESGSVLVEQLLLVNTGLDLVFQDSATNYSAPLHMTSEETELDITIASNQYSLVLSYDLFDELDIDNRALRRAEGIKVKSHSFDSVKISCDSINFDCTSGLLLDKETIITCYF